MHRSLGHRAEARQAPTDPTRFGPLTSPLVEADVDGPIGVLDSAWARPSAGLGRMRQAEVGASAVVILLIAWVATLSQESALPWSLVGLAAACLLLGLPYVGRKARSWRFLERESDLLVERGVMFRRLSVVPYGRMQTVEVAAGPVEQLFHLATVQLHTASAATDARIPGMAPYEAEQLRERLVRRGEAFAEGL